MFFEIAFGNQLFWEDDYSEEMADTFQLTAYQDLYDFKYSSLKNKSVIKITHSTDFYLEYQLFYDGHFIVHEEYDLGHYNITYTDGKSVALPIEYGRNIGSFKQEWDITDQKLAEVTYSTLPKAVSDGVVYETIYENPYPQSEIMAITYIPNTKKEALVSIHSFEVVKANFVATNNNKKERAKNEEKAY
jgi:hypothetical protein